MIFQKRNPIRLRKSPARDRARAGLVALLGEGRCVFSTEDVADIAGISATSARSFLNAAIAVGMVQPLKERIPVTSLQHLLITERFPGAPSSDTITKCALLYVAKGMSESSHAAFAYHSALSLHGLTEVAPTALHVIKIRDSIRLPHMPDDVNYVPKVRPAKHWMNIPGGSPVLLTLRSTVQVAATELVSCPVEGIPIMATSPLLTLVDAWMHPDWCSGADRVTDAWKMYWSRQSQDQQLTGKAELAALLAHTTWPGLWIPLTKWAGGVVPELRKLRETVEDMKRSYR